MRDLYLKMGLKVGLAVAVGAGAHIALTSVKPLLESYTHPSSLTHIQESLTPYEPEIEQYLEELLYDPTAVGEHSREI